MKKERFVILKYEQYANNPMIFCGNGGNLNGGRYDTNVFRGTRFESSVEASLQIDNEIEYIKENNLIPAVFIINPIYF